MTAILICGGITLLAIFIVVANEAAYRNGVNDGYMLTKDPNCPGYRKARRILERYGKISPKAPDQPSSR